MENKKEVRKLIFQQALMVHFCMNCVIGIKELVEYISYGHGVDLDWYIPLSLIVVAFLTTLPTVVFYIKPDLTGYMATLRIILHYALLLAIVLGSGYCFNWYHNLGGAIVMVIIFTIIYVLIWVFTSLIFRHDAKRINAAIAQIRDEE